MKPAMMDPIHCPVPPPAPRPSKRRMYPPTTAPTMPTMIVVITPPGSFPGKTHLASAPAISPTMIQKIIAPSILLRSLLWRTYMPESYNLKCIRTPEGSYLMDEKPANTLEGVMNFDSETIAFWYGDSKTIPKRRFRRRVGLRGPVPGPPAY